MTQSTKIVFFLLLIVTIASVTTATIFGFKFRDLKNGTTGSATVTPSEEEVKNLVAAVGRAIVLHTNENPTVATVADLSKLKDQPFFAHAKVGDKVLIYPVAQKAILWSPTLNKIVDISALASTNQTPVETPKTTLS